MTQRLLTGDDHRPIHTVLLYFRYKNGAREAKQRIVVIWVKILETQIMLEKHFKCPKLIISKPYTVVQR